MNYKNGFWRYFKFKSGRRSVELRVFQRQLSSPFLFLVRLRGKSKKKKITKNILKIGLTCVWRKTNNCKTKVEKEKGWNEKVNGSEEIRLKGLSSHDNSQREKGEEEFGECKWQREIKENFRLLLIRNKNWGRKWNHLDRHFPSFSETDCFRSNFPLRELNFMPCQVFRDKREKNFEGGRECCRLD